MILRPFFRYHGGKWRAVHAGLYPHPLHDTIIEPFAGAAGYSLHYADHRVILVERYHVIAEIWRWLIGATSADVMAVPPVDDVDDLPAGTPDGARYLVGFAMNAAVTSPRRRIARSGLALRASGRRFYGWTEAFRERVAAQVEHIKHWILFEGDYTQAPDIAATHYIDSPYQDAGGGYIHGPDDIDYTALAAWCRARRGQPIVCEAPSANWLPFRPIGVTKAGPRSTQSREALWP